MKKMLGFKEVKIALALILVIGVYGIINIDGTINNLYQKSINQGRKSVLYQRTIQGVQLASEEYNLEKDYVYVGLEQDASNVINKITVTGDGNLKIMNNELRLYQTSTNLLLHKWEYITIAVEELDLSKEYVFNNNQNISTGDIKISGTKRCKPIIRNISGDSKELVLLYDDNDEIKKWDIIEYKSEKYDLSKEYIVTDQNFDIEDGTQIKVYNGVLSIEPFKNRTVVTLKYNEETEQLKQWEVVRYAISEYEYDENYIYANNKTFTVDNINTSTYLCSQIHDQENHEVQIKLDGKIIKSWKIVEYSSEKYKDYIDKDYIYVGTQEFQDSDIVSANMEKEYDQQNQKFRLKVDGKVIKEWNIIKVASDRYKTLDKDYINTGATKPDKSLISVTHAEIIENSNQYQVVYNDTIVKTWTLESFSMKSIYSNSYKVMNEYFVVGKDPYFDRSKVDTINLTLKSEDNYIWMYSNDNQRRGFYKEVMWNSNTYDLTKDYIYVGTKILDTTKITVTNATPIIEDNKLKIKAGDLTLKEWDLIRIETSNYQNFIDNYSFIYTGHNTFESDKVNVINAKKEMRNNQFVLLYNNKVVKAWDIECFSIDDYQITPRNYILIGNKDFDENKIHPINTTYAIKDSQLIIYHSPYKEFDGLPESNTSIYTFEDINYSSNKYDLSKGYIYIGNQELNKNEIIKSDNLDLQENENQLMLMHRGSLVKTWYIVSYSCQNESIATDINQYGYINYGLLPDRPLTTSDFSNKLNTINATVYYDNETNHVELKRENEVLESWPVLGYYSSTYDLSKDYIVTTLDDIELDLIQTIGDMNVEKKDAAIYIKKDNRIIKQTNIYTFKVGNLKISDNIIFIQNNNMTFYELINEIINSSSEAFHRAGGYSLTSHGANQTVEHILEDGDTLIYNANDIYLQFKISKDTLDLGELKVDDENRVIYGIEEKTLFNEIEKEITTNGKISLKDSEGGSVSKDKYLATGYIISIEMSNNTIEYKIAVIGDVTGEGEVDIGDVSKLYSHVRGSKLITEPCELLASDVTGEGEVDIGDVSKLYTTIRRKGR